MKEYQPFHIVTVSPWPLLVGFNVMVMVLGLVKIFQVAEWGMWSFGGFGVTVCSVMWWRDVVRESSFQGSHNSLVVSGLIIGMVLFITSEVFFFVSFFWAYFHVGLSSVVELGMMWPPLGVEPLKAFSVPLLNTIILLSSGVSVTWAHNSVLGGKFSVCVRSLMITWILGVYFLLLQVFEYFSAMFDISYSVFGSVFFMTTGFHGFHVMVGSIFLFVIWVRALKGHFSEIHHFGFEAAAWYWHFVDVVWLFLFSVVYWWGSCYWSNITFDFQSNMLWVFFSVIFLVGLISLLLLCLFVLVSLWVDTSKESVSSYECGFDASSIVRMSFSYRFFLIAILFLIFDVEISLLLPLPFVKWGGISYLVLSGFVTLLVGGLVYEVSLGSMDWL